MNIAFVGSSRTIDPFTLGGIQTIIKELASYLVKAKNDVTFYQIDRFKKGEHELETPTGIISIHYGSVGNLRKMLLTQYYDVINFIQTPFANPVFTVLFYLKKRIYGTTTTKFIFTYPPFRRAVFFQPIKYKWLIDKCYTFSWRLQKEVKSVTPHVCFLYPPVSDDFFQQRGTDRSKGKVCLMYSGRLSRDKGLDVVIDVFQRMDRQKYRLVIAGYFASADDRTIYEEKLKSLNLDELIMLKTNRLSDEFTHPPLHRCDILLLPYQNMTPTVDLPLIVLEGLASGCKVVTSRIGDLPNLRGNIRCVDDFQNPGAFITAIQEADREPISPADYEAYAISNVGQKYLAFLTDEGVS